jgi:hypothetical protein
MKVTNEKAPKTWVLILTSVASLMVALDALVVTTAVPVGNLRSEILVVQPAQNWHRQRATGSLNRTRDRRVLLQR